tara:strand:+ start:216 stop:734 length:519 start_codon:yes stop_codon:yes gene_type:complete
MNTAEIGYILVDEVVPATLQDSVADNLSPTEFVILHQHGQDVHVTKLRKADAIRLATASGSGAPAGPMDTSGEAAVRAGLPETSEAGQPQPEAGRPATAETEEEEAAARAGRPTTAEEEAEAGEGDTEEVDQPETVEAGVPATAEEEAEAGEGDTEEVDQPETVETEGSLHV